MVASVLGTLVAWETARRARAAHAAVGAPSLRRLWLGFLLLGTSQLFPLLLEAAIRAAPASLPLETWDHFDLLFWSYYALLLGGLGFVFASFGRHPFRWAPAFAPLLSVAGFLLQGAVILVLFFIILHAGFNHIARKGTGSSRVAIGFFFVLLAHVVNFYAYVPLQPRTLAGEVLNVVGLAILLLSVPRPGPVSHA